MFRKPLTVRRRVPSVGTRDAARAGRRACGRVGDRLDVALVEVVAAQRARLGGEAQPVLVVPWRPRDEQRDGGERQPASTTPNRSSQLRRTADSSAADFRLTAPCHPISATASAGRRHRTNPIRAGASWVTRQVSTTSGVRRGGTELASPGKGEPNGARARSIPGCTDGPPMGTTLSDHPVASTSAASRASTVPPAARGRAPRRPTAGAHPRTAAGAARATAR